MATDMWGRPLPTQGDAAMRGLLNTPMSIQPISWAQEQAGGQLNVPIGGSGTTPAPTPPPIAPALNTSGAGAGAGAGYGGVDLSNIGGVPPTNPAPTSSPIPGVAAAAPSLASGGGDSIGMKAPSIRQGIGSRMPPSLAGLLSSRSY